jgi:hypothetical protein
MSSLAPLLRGRDERSSLLEGWGEGLSLQIRKDVTGGESKQPGRKTRLFSGLSFARGIK